MTTTTKSFAWDASLAMGNAGASAVKQWLQGRGHVVQSVERARVWQRRDIDFLVDGEFMEVKTDSHASGSLYAELTSDGKPGYLFKSRADTLLYYFPKDDVLYWVDMPKLVWWVAQQKPGLRVFQVQSNRRGRTWLAEGVVVPLEALQAIEAVEVFTLHDDEPQEQVA